jgi:hypothetical protein
MIPRGRGQRRFAFKVDHAPDCPELVSCHKHRGTSYFFRIMNWGSISARVPDCRVRDDSLYTSFVGSLKHRNEIINQIAAGRSDLVPRLKMLDKRLWDLCSHCFKASTERRFDDPDREKAKLCRRHADEHYERYERLFAEISEGVSKLTGRCLLTFADAHRFLRKILTRGESDEVLSSPFVRLVTEFGFATAHPYAFVLYDKAGVLPHFFSYLELRAVVKALREWEIQNRSVRCFCCRRVLRWRHRFNRSWRARSDFRDRLSDDLAAVISSADVSVCSVACARLSRDRAEKKGWDAAKREYRDAVREMRKERGPLENAGHG